MLKSRSWPEASGRRRMRKETMITIEVIHPWTDGWMDDGGECS